MNTTKNSSAEAKPAKPSLYPDVKGYMPKQQVAVGGVVLRSEPIEYNVGAILPIAVTSFIVPISELDASKQTSGFQ